MKVMKIAVPRMDFRHLSLLKANPIKLKISIYIYYIVNSKEKLIKYLRDHGGKIARSKVKWASEELLNELEKEGIISVIRRSNGSSIQLLDKGIQERNSTNSAQQSEEEKGKSDSSEITSLLKEINKKLDIILQKLGQSIEIDFDKVFEEVKNPMGIASLKDIREGRSNERGILL
ncbi:hypothetical protein SULI_12225 [Saccharolobus solfataricus]|nr:hypothetical protein [Saccharolobus solfataricus]AKA74558.1 hypothetical protein SULB_2412 [Saccharolobus solfataricus]AKA77254.1 hypothetical protein SULC_2409 [Saccharolobus solfataricus]AKA79946.1 hypothetical protein SULA_2411 [Saccharolobus solfataricus]AZF69034.1 hypothetical protein SULG_12225 [Saccharolobus solfataricus]AZF71654.1 hypothetical protein SULH_12225 [Saccharolobus solfataricus]